eukprot:1147345-Pelagomonas_calceolata.AAC.3
MGRRIADTVADPVTDLTGKTIGFAGVCVFIKHPSNSQHMPCVSYNSFAPKEHIGKARCTYLRKELNQGAAQGNGMPSLTPETSLHSFKESMVQPDSAALNLPVVMHVQRISKVIVKARIQCMHPGHEQGGIDKALTMRVQCMHHGHLANPDIACAQVIDKARIKQGESHKYCATATGGPFRVVLAWHDYPGDPAAVPGVLTQPNVGAPYAVDARTFQLFEDGRHQHRQQMTGSMPKKNDPAPCFGAKFLPWCPCSWSVLQEKLCYFAMGRCNAGTALVNNLDLELRAAGLGGYKLLGNGKMDDSNNVEAIPCMCTHACGTACAVMNPSKAPVYDAEQVCLQKSGSIVDSSRLSHASLPLPSQVLLESLPQGNVAISVKATRVTGNVSAGAH